MCHWGILRTKIYPDYFLTIQVGNETIAVIGQKLISPQSQTLSTLNFIRRKRLEHFATTTVLSLGSCGQPYPTTAGWLLFTIVNHQNPLLSIHWQE